MAFSTVLRICWPFVRLLWQNAYSVPVAIFKLLFWVGLGWFLVAELYEFVVFWVLTPHQVRGWQMSPIA